LISHTQRDMARWVQWYDCCWTTVKGFYFGKYRFAQNYGRTILRRSFVSLRYMGCVVRRTYSDAKLQFKSRSNQSSQPSVENSADTSQPQQVLVYALSPCYVKALSEPWSTISDVKRPYSTLADSRSHSLHGRSFGHA